MLLALYHTSLANHKIVIWRLCRWWQIWVVKICIKTIAYSRCTFLPAECFRHTTLHPHNVSSFYSNIVQYRFSHPTLCIYYSKIRQKDLTYVPYLLTHFIIFIYSHALTMFPPYTYHCTLCFQKRQHSLQNNSLLWQMLPTKLLSPWWPTPYITSCAVYQPISLALAHTLSHTLHATLTRTKHLHVPVSTSSAF